MKADLGDGCRSGPLITEGIKYQGVFKGHG